MELFHVMEKTLRLYPGPRERDPTKGLRGVMHFFYGQSLSIGIIEDASGAQFPLQEEFIDTEKVIEALETAFSLGHEAAGLLLTKVYSGFYPNISIDKERRDCWLQKTAEKGYAESAFLLGSMYISGSDKKPSHGLDIKWLKAASRLGSAEAKKLLAKIPDNSASMGEHFHITSSICARCGRQEDESFKLQQCSRCKIVKYCSRDC